MKHSIDDMIGLVTQFAENTGGVLYDLTDAQLQSLRTNAMKLNGATAAILYDNETERLEQAELATAAPQATKQGASK